MTPLHFLVIRSYVERGRAPTLPELEASAAVLDALLIPRPTVADRGWWGHMARAWR